MITSAYYCFNLQQLLDPPLELLCNILINHVYFPVADLLSNLQ